VGLSGARWYSVGLKSSNLDNFEGSHYCSIAERFTIWGYNFEHFHWLKAKSGNGEGSGKQHKLGQCEGAQQQLTACRS
jgi:hypothetical protein